MTIVRAIIMGQRRCKYNKCNYNMISCELNKINFMRIREDFRKKKNDYL